MLRRLVSCHRSVTGLPQCEGASDAALRGRQRQKCLSRQTRLDRTAGDVVDRNRINDSRPTSVICLDDSSRSWRRNVGTPRN